jgi:hypothetical protein
VPRDLPPEPEDEAARRMREFLAGLPADPAAMAAAFDQLRTADEAELAANGIHPVSVVHVLPPLAVGHVVTPHPKPCLVKSQRAFLEAATGVL